MSARGTWWSACSPARRPRRSPRTTTVSAVTAMWQERARNLEAQVEQLLALPAHEEEAMPQRRWWRFWQ